MAGGRGRWSTMIAAAILTLCGLAYTVLYAAIRYRPYRIETMPALVAFFANAAAVLALALLDQGCYSRPAVGAAVAIADLVFLTTPRGGGIITSLTSYVALIFTLGQVYRCL